MNLNIRTAAVAAVAMVIAVLVYQTFWASRAAPRHASHTDMRQVVTELANLRNAVGDLQRDIARAQQTNAAAAPQSAAPEKPSAQRPMVLSPFEASVLSSLTSASISVDTAEAAILALRETALSSELALSQLGERDAGALISRGVSGATVDALRALGAQFANHRAEADAKAAAAAAAAAAASAATPAAPGAACPFTKKIGVREKVFDGSSSDRFAIGQRAEQRTQGATPLCGRALDWFPYYTRTDLVRAQQCYQPNKVPRICVGMPVTSYTDVRPSREQRESLQDNEIMVLRTFLKSLISRSRANETRFTVDVYVAIDEGDPYWDNAGKIAHLRESLARMAAPTAFPIRLMDPVVLPLLYGNNVYFWNHALAQGFIDGCDYLYQASDDNEIRSDDMFAVMLDYLTKCIDFKGQKVKNWGISCPSDPTGKLCFQGMVHRSQYQALGWFFHPTYTSWGPDDFITHMWRKIGRADETSTQSYNTDEWGKRYIPCNKNELTQTLSSVAAEIMINWLKTEEAAYLKC